MKRALKLILKAILGLFIVVAVTITGIALNSMNYFEWGIGKGYFTVLPALAKQYHVFAVDCSGQGKSSKDPTSYSSEAMGRDFIQFIKQVIKEPAVVSGHSSGGLLTAWLAADSPENVRGVVLEGPPFFSSELPRYQKTFAYWDTSITCHDFLQQKEEHDFTIYYVEHFSLMKYFNKAQAGITKYA